MTMRRVLWGVIAGLSLLALVGAALLGWVLLRPRPASTLLIADEQARLRVLAAGRDEQVLSSDLAAAPYRFPAVAPDGRRVAYVAADGDTLAIVSHNLSTGERTLVYRSAVGEPFDLAWSPDSRFLVFLASAPPSLALLIVPADGSAEPQVVAAGRNVYFSWKHDGSALAVHVDGHALQNGRVLLYRTDESQSEALVADPGFFQAPAFSRDGSAIFYVAQPEVSEQRLTPADVVGSIVRVGADGQNPIALATEPQAALQIVRSPVSDQIGYNVQQITANGGFEWGALKLLGEDGGEPETLSRPGERVDAFFWSPDGRQIAYLAFTEQANGSRTWNVVDLTDKRVRELATFAPSRSFAELMVFFDAYQHGLSPWSPDSRRLAYAADDGVYVIDIASGTAEKAGEGTMALWAGAP